MAGGAKGSSRSLAAYAAGGVLLVAAVTGLLWYFAGSDAARLAGSPHRSDRLRAIDLLRGRSGAEARRGLFALCSDADPRVAQTAAWALGEYRDAQSASLLRRILSDGKRPGPLRAEAATALGRCHPIDPGWLTGPLASDPDPLVRAGAAKGLYHLRDPRTALRLTRALSDGDERVRREAIGALYHMTSRRFGYRPELPPAQQRDEIQQIEAFVRAALPR